MCMGGRERERRGVYARVFMLEKARVDMVLLDQYLPCLFKQGRSLNPGITDSLDWTARWLKQMYSLFLLL